MPYKVEINTTLKIVMCTYNGIISKEDLSDVWKQLLSLKEFTSLKYNLLSDYRNSKFNIPRKEGNEPLNFLISVEHILRGKKEAAILSNPTDTALSHLMQGKAYDSVGYLVKLFSTREAAIEWLK